MIEQTERTEDDIVAQAPVRVTLGGKEYDLKPLVIKDSREWRRKFKEISADLAKLFDTEGEAVGDALGTLIVQAPDQVIDLFFLYAKDLSREEIESVATEAEIAEAFKEVVKLAFPLVESLGKAIMSASQ